MAGQIERNLIERRLPSYEDYLILWSNSNEDEKVTNYLARVMDRFIPDYLPTYTPNNRLLRFLDIGAGDGRKTIPLVRHIETLGVKVELSVVEPEESCLNAFLANISSKGSGLRLGAVQQMKWHDALAKHADEPYDIVLSSHSAYEYIRHPSSEGTATGLIRFHLLLEATLQVMAPGALFCLILGGHGNAITALREEFLPVVRGEKELDVDALGGVALRVGTNLKTQVIPDQWLDTTRICQAPRTESAAEWQRFIRFVLHVDPMAVAETVQDAIHKRLAGPSQQGATAVPIDDVCFLIGKPAAPQPMPLG